MSRTGKLECQGQDVRGWEGRLQTEGHKRARPCQGELRDTWKVGNCPLHQPALPRREHAPPPAALQSAPQRRASSRRNATNSARLRRAEGVGAGRACAAAAVTAGARGGAGRGEVGRRWGVCARCCGVGSLRPAARFSGTARERSERGRFATREMSQAAMSETYGRSRGWSRANGPWREAGGSGCGPAQSGSTAPRRGNGGPEEEVGGKARALYVGRAGVGPQR